jgi:hypothetical protein
MANISTGGPSMLTKTIAFRKRFPNQRGEEYAFTIVAVEKPESGLAIASILTAADPPGRLQPTHSVPIKDGQGKALAIAIGHLDQLFSRLNEGWEKEDVSVCMCIDNEH